MVFETKTATVMIGGKWSSPRAKWIKGSCIDCRQIKKLRSKSKRCFHCWEKLSPNITTTLKPMKKWYEFWK